MRPSPLRHPLAVLRVTLGKSQKEMADLIGKSTPTVQAIELATGKLELSEGLAKEISRQTGVSLKWLLNGDPNAQPTSDDGEPYTKSKFETRQAILKMSFGEDFLDKHRLRSAIFICMKKLASVVASSVGRGEFPLFIFKFEESLDSLAQQFGEDDVFGSPIAPGKKLRVEEHRQIVKDGPNVVSALIKKCDSILAKQCFNSAAKRQSKQRSARRPAK